MLLFKKEHLEPIYSGLKTQTRRLWKKQRVKVGAIHQIKLKLFDKKNYGRVIITDVKKEKLLDITEEDAKSEGGYNRKTYLEKWFEITPSSPPNPEVFVVNFKFKKGE